MRQKVRVRVRLSGICDTVDYKSAPRNPRLFTDGTVGWTAIRSPHPGPLLWGEGELSTVSRLHAGRSLPKDHRLNTNRTPAVPSLPPSRRSGALARREGGRERVRVKGKHSVEQATRSRSRRLLSIPFLRIAAVTLSLDLLFLAAGCQTVGSLRDAQDTFNRAAADQLFPRAAAGNARPDQVGSCLSKKS